MKLRNVALRYGPKLAVTTASIAAAASAMAEDPLTALAAVQSLSGSSTGFGPVMYGIAVVSVGILIGVKWIKRSKGAA